MANITRRQAWLGIAGVAGSSLATPAWAQGAYPAGLGTLKIVIPFAAGGASDIIGRLLADSLAKRWGVPAVLEHVPGGAATVGIGRVANGPKDGSQVLILPISYVTTQFLMAKLPYDPERDVVPLLQLTRQPSLLCVKKDLAVGSVAEFIAYAKANPGKLNFASSGVGTPLHLAAELFKRMTATDMVHVPYAGSAPAKNDLVGGHVDVLFDNAASIIDLARSGSVKALGITTPARSALAPEFPPVAETVPGYAIAGWLGAAVSGGTPAAIQQVITSACREALQEPAIIQRLASVVSEPAGTHGDAFNAFLDEERGRWGPLIRDLKIKT